MVADLVIVCGLSVQEAGQCSLGQYRWLMQRYNALHGG